jgi:hypothetical protein
LRSRIKKMSVAPSATVSALPSRSGALSAMVARKALASTPIREPR